MLNRLKAINRPHFDAISALLTRDISVQVGSTLLICLLTFWVGHWALAIFVALWIVGIELIIIALFGKRFSFVVPDKDTALLFGLFIGPLNAVVYLLPSVFLAGNSSLAIKLTAVLWVLGAQIHLTNTWSRIPTFLYARLLPALMMLVLTMLQMSSTAPIASTQLEWSFTAGFVVLFIYVTIETVRHHTNTQWSLVKAEAEASARANQLEDSQRIDVLTQTLNRAAFDKALNVMLEDMAFDDGQIAVFMIDLDNFKPINDTYSHVAGDTVLEEIADRLNHVVGDTGIVGRMGGDEFICAMYDLEDKDAALQLGCDFSQIISRAIPWNDHQLKVYASVGIAITDPSEPSSPATVGDLCSAADLAMYLAKSSPKPDPVLFDPTAQQADLSALDKQALIEAVSSQSLRPYYQPKFDMTSGKVIGFEALARWHHPDGTVRNPKEFVSQIRELGLQADFMTSIAQQVATDVQRMIDSGLPPGQMSFNVPEIALATVSGRRDLQSIIAAHPDIAKHLTFEITEDVFIARAAEAMQTSITAFRALGIRMSLDDFGTGFASFHHLQKLDFDELKIDTSFVSNLGNDCPTDVLVRGFLDIASGLGIDVVAEGVETASQRDDLIAMGCKTAQGYLFSPAVPFEQAIELLQNQCAA